MKTAKRVLAILVTLIMVVGTCTVAASAAGTLQAQIDNGATNITLTKNTTESITVNRDLTINLNGYRLLGETGTAAIKVTGGNVTVTDGQVISVYPDIDINAENVADQIKAVFNNSPAAIVVRNGASLTVEGVRIVGGMIKIPMVNEYVPTGSAIMSYDNSNVTIKRSSLYGDYGVNNKVMYGVPGAAPEIEDAVIFAYTKAIKGDEYVLADGSEVIDVVGRVSGALKGGRRLDADEQELLGNLLNDRTLLITKTADAVVSAIDATYPQVTINSNPNVTTAEVDADILNYAWSNTKGTDCSYILVPEGVTLSNGTVAPLGTVDKTLLDTEKTSEDDFVSQIVYRVEFQMGDEAAPYIKNIENYIDLDWVLRTLDSAYNDAYYCPASEDMDSYKEIVDYLGSLMDMYDRAGNETLYTDPTTGEDVTIREVVGEDLYFSLQGIVYGIGGNALYKAAHNGANITKSVYKHVLGVDNLPSNWRPADGIYGTLDKIEKLRTTYETYTPLAQNTDKLGELAVWMYTDVYPTLVEALDELVNAEDGWLVKLLAITEDENFGSVSDFLGIGDKLDLIQKGINLGQQALRALDKAMENGDVAAVFDYLDNNTAKVQGFVDKAVDVMLNYRDYIAIDELIDGDFVKTYSTLGTIEFVPDDTTPSKLNVSLEGNGTASVTISGTENDSTTTEGTSAYFFDSFTLTANETEDKEFLYWANCENSKPRILSTEKTFTMNTNLSTDILAVFNEKGPNAAKAIFTNPSGAICDITNAAVDGSTAGNYTVTPAANLKAYIGLVPFTGWPGLENGVINTNALPNDAYFTGSSAFAADNVFYGPEGAILKIRESSDSFIITPTYSADTTYTVTLLDCGETGTAVGKYAEESVVYTSGISGPGYWIDQNGTIVSVTKDLKYLILGDATLTAVAGECPKDYVFNTKQIETSDKVQFVLSRSTKDAIIRTGAVFSGANFCDPAEVNTLPTVDGENCLKTTVLSVDNNGTYIISFNKTDNRLGKTVYVRPYVEFENGDVVYTEEALSYTF